MSIKVGLLLALCGIAVVQSSRLKTVLSKPNIRDCHPLVIPICQGYGYVLTSLNETEQIAVSAEIHEVRQFDNLSPGTSPIHIPYLCYALAPKCVRGISYDVRPCKEACKQFVNEVSESEIMALRGWREWTSKLRCNTFKSSKGRSQCLPYNKLLQHALAKPDVIPIAAELANSNMTVGELLAAKEAMEKITANMANQTDMSAMMDSINQMMELATSLGIPLPEGFDAEALTIMQQQFGPGMMQGLPEGVNLEALMNLGAGPGISLPEGLSPQDLVNMQQQFGPGMSQDGPDMAAEMNSMNQMREMYNSMNIPIPEDMNPEAWARMKQEFGIE